MDMDLKMKGFGTLSLIHPLLTKPDSSEHVVQRSKANGGAKAPMKCFPFIS
jgi:hypothetical protein